MAATPPPPSGAPPPPPPPGPPGGTPPGPPPPPGGMPPSPPPGYGYGYPQQQPSSGTNGLAIASLVLGILAIPTCFLVIPSVLAIIFGAIALNQIKSRPGQGGRGMAIAGLVLGGISLLLLIGLFALGNTNFTVDGNEFGVVVASLFR